jgi:hypothetical protein
MILPEDSGVQRSLRTKSLILFVASHFDHFTGVLGRSHNNNHKLHPVNPKILDILIAKRGISHFRQLMLQ